MSTEKTASLTTRRVYGDPGMAFHRIFARRQRTNVIVHPEEPGGTTGVIFKVKHESRRQLRSPPHGRHAPPTTSW